MAKLRHKIYRSTLKKLRRKKKRQTLAKARDEKEKEEELRRECDPSYLRRRAELEATDELLREADERWRERMHQNWLSREKLAQLEFQKKQAWEMQMQKNKEEQARKIQEEWDALQRREKEEQERKEAVINKKKEQQAALYEEATKQFGGENGPWHNPPAPANYGTELDRQNCPFYIKTGACRFGDRCSRVHPKPSVSCTLLLPGMFAHFSMEQGRRDDYDADIGLEFDDKEFVQHFRDFYDDVLPEFKQLGEVVQFKVCRNHEQHLRGNVYVQFNKEEEALQAFLRFNGRFYAGKQLTCEFSAVNKWKLAICGLFRRNRCPKGKNCNFLHVFPNPDNEFFEADRDLSPGRGSPASTTRSSYRSSDRRRSRSRSPDWRRDRSRCSRHSSSRSYSRERSRESSRKSSSSSRSYARSSESSRSRRNTSRGSTPSSDKEQSKRRPKSKQRRNEIDEGGGTSKSTSRHDDDRVRNGDVHEEGATNMSAPDPPLANSRRNDTEKPILSVSKEGHESPKNRLSKKSKKSHHKHKKQKSKRRSSSSESSD